MKNPLNIIAREPVMAAIIALVGATVALLVAFHVHVTADQREAIEGWVGAALALGLAVRNAVTPNASQPAAEHRETARAILAAHVAAAAPAPAPVTPVESGPVLGPDHPA